MVVTEVKDTPLAEAFVKAADELGYQRVDVNGEESFGKYSVRPFLPVCYPTSNLI